MHVVSFAIQKVSPNTYQALRIEFDSTSRAKPVITPLGKPSLRPIAASHIIEAIRSKTVDCHDDVKENST